MLIDRARIFVNAGDGGNGSSSFRREKYVPRGGPDGGDGGRGGDVRLRVKPNLTSLLPFQFTTHFRADSGGPGRSQQRHGASGKTLFVDIPPGTIVFDDESGVALADLTDPGEEMVVAKGGKGGLGNVHFKSSTHQAPRIAELGEPGQERWIRLELRLIADVGLVGLPNAGKSTLLSTVSRARPKIADYPFTTLQPYLGVVEVGGVGGQTVVIADIPGLIEGAAAGAGLGHEFLRHVRRTKVLVHVLDASGGLEGRDPLVDFRTINRELADYDEQLAQKPMIVALNKIDLPEARERLPELQAALKEAGYQTFPISAATGAGIAPLLNAIAEFVREAERQEAERPKEAERRRYTIDNTDDHAWHAQRLSDHDFAVTGAGIERFTKMTNFAIDESVDRFQRMLERSGISQELERLGVEPGDIVHIAGRELTWGEEYELDELE
ncbi:MAG TPA: GTPase ObgE [Thermomicrobiales bacterium]|nr:GTPase ObgE [Thermomicrobiales bacterium]